MKVLRSLSHARLVLVVLVLTAGTIISTSLWRVAALRPGEKTVAPENRKETLKERLRNGVGSEVRFAAPNASRESVDASVRTVADFIYRRSNMAMSAVTKERLAETEWEVLNGRRRRISVDELPDVFTEIATQSLATLTDKEISRTVGTFSTPQGEVSPRMRGAWGLATEDELSAELRTGREESRRRSPAFMAELNAQVKQSVEEKTSALVELAPEQFGELAERGVTPLQALLIGYSIAANDPLDGSDEDLAAQIKEQRIGDRQTRPKDKAFRGRAKPYGINGELQASPLNLAFSQAGVDILLSHVEKGGGR